MKRMVSVVLVCMFVSAAAFAATEGQVVYVGGTAKLAAGAAGRLDTTPSDELVFESAGTKLAIPYKAVESFSEETKMAHPLGVLPIVAVGLVTRLHRLHYVRISYRDGDVAQVAVFEVPKEMPQVLMPILQARSPKKSPSPRRVCEGGCASSPCATSPTCNVSK
jgi:hypothetical protein